MNLSVSSFPYSVDGVASVVLLVSVTDANGRPYTGLQAQNFEIRWMDFVNADKPINSIALYEFAQDFGGFRGLYRIEVRSHDSMWRDLQTFFISVEESAAEGRNRGQVLYRLDHTAYQSLNP